MGCGATVHVTPTWPVRHEPTRFYKLLSQKHRREPGLGRQVEQPLPVLAKDYTEPRHAHSARALLHHRPKGRLKYQINDPYYNTKTLDDWNDQFEIRGVITDPPDSSALDFSVDTSADLTVTNSNNQRTGYDPSTGNFLNEIPFSAHFIDSTDDAISNTIDPGDSHSVYLSTPARDTYKVTITGLSIGTYTMLVQSYTTDGASQLNTQVPGISGNQSTATVQIKYSPTPGASSPLQIVATFAGTLADISNGQQLGLISRGIATALSSTINAAAAQANAGNNSAAINILTAFINQVNAQSGQPITQFVAQVLLNDGNSLKASLS
jgi:hypothetical protein